MSGRRAKKLRRQAPNTVDWFRVDCPRSHTGQIRWVWRTLAASPPSWRRQIGRLLRAGLRAPQERPARREVAVRSVWDDASGVAS